MKLHINDFENLNLVRKKPQTNPAGIFMKILNMENNDNLTNKQNLTTFYATSGFAPSL